MVSTHTDEKPEQSEASSDWQIDPPPPGVFARLRTTTRTAGVWFGSRVTETWEWARQQPPRMLTYGAVAVVLGLVLAYGALRVLAALLTGFVGLVTGSGSSESAPMPPPQPPPEGNRMPPWMAELGHGDLWSGLGGNLARFVKQQAAATGVPGEVLLTAWGIAGAVLLLVTVLHAWFTTQHRVLVTVAWWAWVAATVWLLFTLTPGGNLVPAALAAAAGVLVSIAPLTTVLGAGGVFAVALLSS